MQENRFCFSRNDIFPYFFKKRNLIVFIFKSYLRFLKEMSQKESHHWTCNLLLHNVLNYFFFEFPKRKSVRVIEYCIRINVQAFFVISGLWQIAVGAMYDSPEEVNFEKSYFLQSLVSPNYYKKCLQSRNSKFSSSFLSKVT